ncbi:MAG: helix-turn-helix domain-containing protein [Anaerovibrio sp.]
MNINQRIKMLRKEMGLNQKDFGAKIGLGQAGLSRLEQDGVVVIDQNIRLICDTFNISENWLRNGEGPKEAANTKNDLLDEVRDTYKLNSTEEQIMRIYLQLDEHSRDIISGYVKKLATAITTAQEISNKKNSCGAGCRNCSLPAGAGGDGAI